MWRGCSQVIHTIILMTMNSTTSLSPAPATPFPPPTLFVITMLFSLPSLRDYGLNKKEKHTTKCGPQATRYKYRHDNLIVHQRMLCMMQCNSYKPLFTAHMYFKFSTKPKWPKHIFLHVWNGTPNNYLKKFINKCSRCSW